MTLHRTHLINSNVLFALSNCIIIIINTIILKILKIIITIINTLTAKNIYLIFLLPIITQYNAMSHGLRSQFV